MDKYRTLQPLSNEAWMIVTPGKMNFTTRLQILWCVLIGRNFHLSTKGNMEDEYDG